MKRVGGQHAPDSIVVDVAMLTSLVHDRHAWYIGGHDRPHSRAALAAIAADA